MKPFITSLLLLFILFAGQVEARSKGKAYQVTYNSVQNGKPAPGRGLTLRYYDGVAYLSEDDAKIRSFIDYNQLKTVTILNYENELFSTLTPFDSLPQPTAGNQQEELLGYTCNYASFSAFSNKIEVWYTDKAGAKGGPYQAYLPNNESLVLKVTFNGNRTLVASEIEKISRDSIPSYPLTEAKEVSASELEELKIKSRYTSMPIFEDEMINFDPSIEIVKDEPLEANKTYRFSKGSVIVKKITLPEIWKKGGSIHAKLTSWSNGDAYDRTGSVFVLPGTTDKNTMLSALQHGLDQVPVFVDNNGGEYQGFVSTTDYNTPTEIMRFFTSFGIGHFNTRRVINNYPWELQATYNQEVTELIPNDQDEIWVGVFIGNYDRGGHKVNLEFNFFPGFGDEKAPEHYIQPLFYTINIMEMSGQNYGRLFGNDTLEVEFEVPEDIENLQLLYTSTGHGGWGGGDEFNPKLNQIFIDGEAIYKVVPWRTDCATYRFSNPASGNFGNGLSSSDLSRSNWCPATLTPPDLVPLKDLKPGKHKIQVVIDQGENAGSSFSHWSVSGVLTGTQKTADQ